MCSAPSTVPSPSALSLVHTLCSEPLRVSRALGVPVSAVGLPTPSAGMRKGLLPLGVWDTRKWGGKWELWLCEGTCCTPFGGCFGSQMSAWLILDITLMRAVCCFADTQLL